MTTMTTMYRKKDNRYTKYWYINTDVSIDIKDAQIGDLETVVSLILGVTIDTLPKYSCGAPIIEFDLEWQDVLEITYNYAERDGAPSPCYVSNTKDGLQDWLNSHLDK